MQDGSQPKTPNPQGAGEPTRGVNSFLPGKDRRTPSCRTRQLTSQAREGEAEFDADKGREAGLSPFFCVEVMAKQPTSIAEPEEETQPVLAEAGRLVWRLEYTVLIGVGLLLTFFAIAFFYFSSDISNLKSYGYVGLFLVNLIGAASILLPSPAGASVVGGGALLDDSLGGARRGAGRGDRRVQRLRGGVRRAPDG